MKTKNAPKPRPSSPAAVRKWQVKVFRRQLADLGMTHAAAARVLGVSSRTVGRWATGRSPIHFSVNVLLSIMCSKAAHRRFAKNSRLFLTAARRHK